MSAARPLATLIALFALAAIILPACEDNPIDLTFVNETDQLVCFRFSDLNAEARSDCNQEVKPNDTTVWRPECGQPETIPFTVVLTLGPQGDIIYNVTAPCNEWIDSGSTITIEQRGGEFIVTDSLAD